MNTHFSKVKSVKRVGRIEKTYNLQIAKNRNYFSNGVLLHNCVDDPHNVLHSIALSEKELQNTLDWWDLVMPTRLNDPKKGIYIIIMQRCHPKDLTGHILARELDAVHVCLPAEFDSKHPNKWFKDPRTVEGELLCPDRFGRKEIDGLKKKLGTFGASGQLQQLPTPREGGMIKSGWFKIIPALPTEARRRLRFWDRAATQKKKANDPDWTAGTRMSRTADGRVFIEHIDAFRLSSMENEKRIKQRAQLDGHDVQIYIEQEPGSSGVDTIDHYCRNVLSGFATRGKRSTGSKESYIDVLAAQAEAGNVYIVRQSDADDTWIALFLQQVEQFPLAVHDDLLDSAAKAYSELNLNGVNVRDPNENVDEDKIEENTQRQEELHAYVNIDSAVIAATPNSTFRDPEAWD